MIIGITTTKNVSFRTVAQEFSNTYFYYLLGAATAPWKSLVDEIVAVERQLHSSDVVFVRSAAWDASGTPAQNEMMFQQVESGFGLQAANATMDRERAILIRWAAGKDVRGKPVYLRKWYHSCGNVNGISFATGQLANTQAIPDTSRATIATKVNELRYIGLSDAWTLCAKSGRLSEGDAECHKFLEHHQLGDMWR